MTLSLEFFQLKEILNFKELNADSPKADVLKAVLAGEKVHKISPAFPINWTQDEMNQMAEHVYQAGQEYRERAERDPIEIPAVNYENKPLSGGLLNWVNLVRTGRKLKYNPYIQRGKRIKPGGRTSRQIWKETSHILLAEYRYWSQKLYQNRQLMSSGRGYLVEYPKIGNLPFRNNDVFLGGEWNHFRSFWDEFIEEMK